MSSLANPIRVLLADDHTLVRAGIRALLERLRGVQVVAEASDGREVLELLKACGVDIVLMDVAMPGLNGIESTRRIVREFPAVKVVILSMHQNEEYLRQALTAGASGYLLKKAATVELEAALSKVMAGEAYLSRELSGRLGRSSVSSAVVRPSPLERLTERQREILQMVSEGQTTKEIAYVLKVSPKTVEYHRAQIMSRLGIYDVAGLVRFALRSGLTVQEP